MKKIILFVLILGILFFVSLLYFFNHSDEILYSSYKTNPDKVLRLVSEWRVSHGLSPISKNKHLCKIAKERAVEVQTDWSHDKFNGPRVCNPVACEAGENLSKEIPLEDSILYAWEMSPTHLAVLNHSSYKYGCVEENNGFVVLLMSDVELK